MSLATSARSTASSQAAQAVAVRHLYRSFETSAGSRPVLFDLDLDIAPGEILAILGTSGCGKSTLLRQISGLDTPTGGEIRIGSRIVSGIDPRTAIAFQEPRLLPWRTLAQNIRLGLPPGTSRADGRARVAQLLELVGLTASADLRPRQVSGGMAQRAALARALARNPAVLLLDEPFGALDALTRLRMQDLLVTIHAAEPTTVVLVTHDVDEALALADRIVVLGTLDAASPTPSIRSLVQVPGPRPRDHAEPALAALRSALLSGLGVPTRTAPPVHVCVPSTGDIPTEESA